MSWLLIGSCIAAGVVGLAALYVFLVRPWHLFWGATREEVLARLPGDDLVQQPKGEATHAITIHAPAAQVWPWLVQLGQDRAGFYSYTWLENLFGCHMRNTYRIVPAWQELRPGDGVLFHPRFPRLPAAVVEPNHALVVGGFSTPTPGGLSSGGRPNPVLAWPRAGRSSFGTRGSAGPGSSSGRAGAGRRCCAAGWPTGPSGSPPTLSSSAGCS